MKHIARFVPTNDLHDRDGHKHVPKVKKRLPPEQKVLLITSSKSAWVDSLERRGYAMHHAATLGAVGYFFLVSRRQKDSLLSAARRQKRSVERAEGQVLVLDYDELFNSAETLSEFLEIDDLGFRHDFPARRRRASDATL